MMRDEIGDAIIRRDTKVLGNNVYIGFGNGCGTIWFKTVTAARKALKIFGEVHGRDLYDCGLCGCSLYGRDKGYQEFNCREVKETYAKYFESKKPEVKLIEAFILDCKMQRNL